MINHRARQGHYLVAAAGALQHIARASVIGRPLAAGALTEHAPQAQENKDGQRQKNDGVDIHVVHFLIDTNRRRLRLTNQ